MNLVFLGPDGAGKTTLAQECARILDMKYYKGSHVDTNKYAKACELIKTSRFTVFDRFYFPDEPLYRMVKKDPLEKGELLLYNNLECEMLKKEFGIIFVSASHDVLVSRLVERGDDFIFPEEIADIQRRYEAFLQKTCLPYVRIETDAKDPEQCLAEVLQGVTVMQQMFNYE